MLLIVIAEIFWNGLFLVEQKAYLEKNTRKVVTNLFKAIARAKNKKCQENRKIYVGFTMTVCKREEKIKTCTCVWLYCLFFIYCYILSLNKTETKHQHEAANYMIDLFPCFSSLSWETKNVVKNQLKKQQSPHD